MSSDQSDTGLTRCPKCEKRALEEINGSDRCLECDWRVSSTEKKLVTSAFRAAEIESSWYIDALKIVVWIGGFVAGIQLAQSVPDYPFLRAFIALLIAGLAFAVVELVETVFKLRWKNGS